MVVVLGTPCAIPPCNRNSKSWFIYPEATIFYESEGKTKKRERRKPDPSEVIT
jgi:hypothetical protein